MVGAAAAVLSIQASADDRGPTEYTDILFGEDYLVCVDGAITYTAEDLVDDNFLVKRNSTLKWVEFDTPGNSAVDYTKVAYSVNLKLRDISAFTDGVTTMVVADLTVRGYVTYSPWISLASVSINGIEVMSFGGVALGTLPFITSEYDALTGTLSAQVTLPDLALIGDLKYNDEDLVSIFVMFKSVETPLIISGSEVGFPEYQISDPL
jgi:hypothetical protein